METNEEPFSKPRWRRDDEAHFQGFQRLLTSSPTVLKEPLKKVIPIFVCFVFFCKKFCLLRLKPEIFRSGRRHNVSRVGDFVFGNLPNLIGQQRDDGNGFPG